MDVNTQRHCLRTSNIASQLAKEINIDEKMIKCAALVHDVGKAFISKNLLNKKGQISVFEREVLDLHSYFGYRYLKEIEADERICNLVLYHHGYDKNYVNLKPEIPINTKLKTQIDVLKAADAYDALTSKRSYRNACEHHIAIEIMRKDRIFNEKIIFLLDFLYSSSKNKNESKIV